MQKSCLQNRFEFTSPYVDNAAVTVNYQTSLGMGFRITPATIARFMLQ